MPTKEDLVAWVQRELYPIVRDTILVVDNNASQLARTLYKVRTRLADVEDYLANKIQVVAPLSVEEVEDPVTGVRSLKFSVTTEAPSGSIDDGTIRVTSLDTKEYAGEKVFGVSPIRTTIVDKSGGGKAIEISLDPTVSDPTAGGTLYPAELATPNAPVDTVNPVVEGLEYVTGLFTYSDDAVGVYYRQITGGTSFEPMPIVLPNDPELYFIGLTLEVIVPFSGTETNDYYLDVVNQISFSGYNPITRVIPSLTEYNANKAANGGSFIFAGHNIGSDAVSPGATFYSMSELRFECVGQTLTATLGSSRLLQTMTAGSFRLTATLERRSSSNMQRYNREYLFDTYPISSEMTGITVPLNTGQADTPTVAPYVTAPQAGRTITGLSVRVDVPWNTGAMFDECFMEIKDKAGNVLVPALNLSYASENYTYTTGLLNSDFQSQALALRIWCTTGKLYQLNNDAGIAIEYTFKDTAYPAPTVTGHNLLTGSQLATESVNQEDVELEETLSSAGETSMGLQFFTLAGTPGVVEIPAGPFTFRVYGKVDGTSSGVTNSWRAKMMVWINGNPSPETPFLTATSTSVSNTSFAVTEFSADLASPITVTALDLIGVEFFAVTDGSDARTFTLRYNEITRQTSVQTTIPGIAGGGAISHASTTQRDAPESHPEAAITQEIGEATVVSSIVVPPTGFRAFTVPGTSDLNGMEGDGRMTLFLPEARKLLHGQAVASGYPFWFPTFGTGSHLDIETTEAMSSVVLQLITHSSVNSGNPCWIVVSSLNY